MANVVVASGMAEGFLPNLSARRLQDQEQVLSTDELEALRQMQLASVEELPEVSRSDQTQHRLRHLEALRAAGMDPYPLGGEIRSNGAPILGVKDALSIFSSEIFQIRNSWFRGVFARFATTVESSLRP